MFNKKRKRVIKILAIVVTYNGIDWIDYCIGSLISSTPTPDIICIDNNSTDGTQQFIAEHYPNVELVKSEKNLGFGKGNNLGLRQCIDEGYDYAFLLNQDARVEPDTIQKLVATHKQNTQYGVLSPIHRAYDNSILDENFTFMLRSSNTPKYISHAMLGIELKDIYETKFVNAALWLISNECLLKVGFFDPIFTHYCEDDDFLDRVQNSGFKVGIVPSALANHARNQKDGLPTQEDTKNLRSVTNRDYVNLLLRFKRYQARQRSKILYFLREMLSEIFLHAIMLDPQNLKKTVLIYYRLFKAVRTTKL
jgi:GT2 family glycosyltransferase